MRPHAKFILLLESLKSASEAGRVEWTETLDVNTYRVPFDKASVRVGQFYDYDGDDKNDETPKYQAVLTDEKGNWLEVVTSKDDDGRYALLIMELFELARRSARKLDDLLDSLISNISTRKAVKRG